MAEPATFGLVRTEMRYTWNGEQCENVWHFERISGGTDSANMEALNDLLAAWWSGNLKAQMTNQCILREVYSESYGGANNSLANAVVVNDAGTSTVESLPNNCTLCVGFRSIYTGRARRGRTYLPGMTTAHSLGTYATPAYRDALIAAFDWLAGLLLTAGWQHVIASLYEGGLPRGEVLTSAVTSYNATDLALDSQRRRLPGRGT